MDYKLCNALSTERYILHLHVLLECYNILSLKQGKLSIGLFVKNDAFISRSANKIMSFT